SSSNIFDAADSAPLSRINCAIPFCGSYFPSSPVSVPAGGSSLAGICCPNIRPVCINKRAAIIAAKNFIFMIECKVRGSELYGGRCRAQRVHLGKPATQFGKPRSSVPFIQMIKHSAVRRSELYGGGPRAFARRSRGAGGSVL